MKLPHKETNIDDFIEVYESIEKNLSILVLDLVEAMSEMLIDYDDPQDPDAKDAINSGLTAIKKYCTVIMLLNSTKDRLQNEGQGIN